MNHSPFAKHMYYWHDVCLDTTLYAVETKEELEDPIEKIEDLINFSKTHFLPKEGGFYTNIRKYPTLYGTQTASKLDRKTKNSVGKKIIEPGMEDKIKDFIEGCKKETEDKIGFGDTPYKPSPEFFSTQVATKILTGRGWLEDKEKEKIKNFITSELDLSDNPQKIHDVYLALDSLKMLGNSEKYIEETEPEIIDFVESCWKEDSKKDKRYLGLKTERKKYGGFKPTPWFDYIPVHHTKRGIDIMEDILNKDISELDTPNMEDKIINYLEECERDGGFVSEEGFAPNVLATLNTIQILQDFNRKDLLDKYREGVIDFVNSCKPENRFGYTAFPVYLVNQ